jgi:hypothetical protein
MPLRVLVNLGRYDALSSDESECCALSPFPILSLKLPAHLQTQVSVSVS